MGLGTFRLPRGDSGCIESVTNAAIISTEEHVQSDVPYPVMILPTMKWPRE